MRLSEILHAIILQELVILLEYKVAHVLIHCITYQHSKFHSNLLSHFRSNKHTITLTYLCIYNVIVIVILSSLFFEFMILLNDVISEIRNIHILTLNNIQFVR